jgi:hypothetical protein
MPVWTDRDRARRPAFVTWLAVAVLLLAGANGLAAVGGAVRWPLLTSLELTLPPWALVAPAAVWGAIWLIIAFGLWRLRAWARWALMLAFPLYEIIVIGQQTVFARGGYERGRLPFAAGLAVLLTGAVVFLMTRRRVREAFRPTGDTEDSPTEETPHS